MSTYYTTTALKLTGAWFKFRTLKYSVLVQLELLLLTIYLVVFYCFLSHLNSSFSTCTVPSNRFPLCN